MVLTFLIVACNPASKDAKKENKIVENTTYSSFGDQLSSLDYISSDDALSNYKALKLGDTINLKFNANIKEVCSKKGCWMTLPAGSVIQHPFFEQTSLILALNFKLMVSPNFNAL